MRYPTPGAYQEAVQFPETAFSDPLLQEAEPEESVLGLPRAITGAFAVVFPVRTRAARWAVKCFVTHVSDQQDRYRAISQELRRADLSYTVPFEYQAGGIRVDGESYPILKMEWIEAETLQRYVARSIEHPDRLEALVGRWREMIGDLEAAGIAHGDLQHGNVLVEKDGGLRLVDYDTMFVPELRGKESPEVGHRNYQHADRDETDFGPYLDRFPALVIDTGLRACAAQPDLWKEFDTGENILFRSGDLADPSQSALFERLMTVDHLADQVEALRRACYLEPEDIPPLSVVTSDVSAVPQARPGKQRDRKGAFERFIYPVAAVILLVVALTQAVGSLDVIVMVLSAALIFAGLLGWLKYRQLPVVRRKRRLEKEHDYFEHLLQGLRDEHRRLEAQREELRTSHDARYRERLEELQDEALSNLLKYHFIGEAREFEGITHKAVVRLKASGIRTAAHATPERVEGITQMSAETKGRVNLWRAALVSRYRDQIPESLSPAEERRLQRALDHELETVDAELARIGSKITVQEDEHQKIVERRKNLDVPSFPGYLASLARTE